MVSTLNVFINLSCIYDDESRKSLVLLGMWKHISHQGKTQLDDKEMANEIYCPRFGIGQCINHILRNDFTAKSMCMCVLLYRDIGIISGTETDYK